LMYEIFIQQMQLMGGTAERKAHDCEDSETVMSRKNEKIIKIDDGKSRRSHPVTATVTSSQRGRSDTMRSRGQ
jgi:hypothetical protein